MLLAAIRQYVESGNRPRSDRRLVSYSKFALDAMLPGMGRKSGAKKIPKPQRRCMFCDGLPLSREHMFPEWMSKVVPRAGNMRRQVLSAPSRTLAVAERDTISNRQGDLLGKRLLVVCKPCNEGWMEDIERAARPILTPLLRGEGAVLTPKAQQIIAVWSALRAIICEKSDAPTAIIPAEAIKQLYLTKTLHPWLWKIWIGHYAGTQWSISARYTHSAAKFFVNVTTQHGISYRDTGYLQTSTFGIGKLYIHAFCSTIPAIYSFDTYRSYRLHSILPAANADVTWPPACPINDVDAHDIAFNLKRAAGL
jgi:hypothetical protein